MSKWDKYRVEYVKPVNKWDKYKIAPLKEKQGDTWPELLGKSAFKGFSSVSDIPSLAAKTVERGVNYTQGNPAEVYWAAQNPYNKNIPKIEIIENAPKTNYSQYVPSSEHLKSAIKNYTGYDLEPNPTSPAQNIVSKGIEFGTSMTPWALGGKGLTLADKFKNAAKATKEATAVGLGSGALQESGVNPLAADLISSAVTPNIRPPSFRDTLKIPKKTAMKLMGLGPKRLNIKTAQAARDLGVELPAAVVTDNTLTGLADQAISKTPFFGNTLKNKYDKANSQIYGKLGEVYNEIGPQRTPEIEKKIFDLYEKRKNELPTNAVVKPVKAAAALDKIKINSALLSPEEKQLSKELEALKNELTRGSSFKIGNEKIPFQDVNVKIPLQNFNVDRLIGTKQSLNSIIKWDIPEGVRNQLRNVQRGISEDIAEYGKTNPKWYETYKEADDLFSKVAKREKVQEILRNEGLNEPENLSYAMLSRSINDKKKNKLLQKNVSPETFEKIKSLGVLANAMVQKNRRIPNPSGTAATAVSLGFLSGVFFDPTSVVTTGSALAGGTAYKVTKLLTDKKFLDLALQYAETEGKSKISTAMKLNKRAKDITGYTLNSLYQSARRNSNNKEAEDELQ